MQKMTTRFLAIMLVQLTLVSTLYCQTALQQAISLVNASASPLPPGVTVSFGSVKGGFDAQFDPDGSKITISKENIAANHPDLVGDPGDLPVVLAVILHHEGKHAAEYIAGTDPPIYNSACGEVLLQHESLQ